MQIEHQANYDTLTGLPNRTLLHDRLRQAVSTQRHMRAIAVVFIDLDHFKFVNGLGHSVGDELLKKVPTARPCCATVPWHLGGDEFVLILNDQNNEEVVFRAMQRLPRQRPTIRQGALRHVRRRHQPHPQDGPDVDTLLKNADVAMYRAKEAGRNNSSSSPRNESW